MLDIKFVRTNPDIVKQNIKNKFQDEKLPLVDEVIALDLRNREIKQEVEALRAEKNKASKMIGAMMAQKKIDEAEELKKNLSEMQFYVTQNHGTEPPFTGRLLHNKRDGVYHCLICDAPLFHSETKYDSGCGWPSFYEPVSEESIRYIKDLSHGRQRIELRCGNCGAHLGHVFPDGPQPTGERYCVNSASLRFTDGENGEEING